MLELNLALRAGLVALLLLLAWLLWRDHGRAVSARLGAAAATGLAAYALLLALCRPGELPPPVLAPLVALATGNAVVFWLLARALFNEEGSDAAPLRPWHGLVWAALALAGLIACRGLAPPAGPLLQGAIGVATLGLALAALQPALATWRADLVARRRRLRLFIVVAGVGYTGVNSVTKLLLDQPDWAPRVVLIDAVALAAVVLPLVAQLLRGGASELFVAEVQRQPLPAHLAAGVAEPAEDTSADAPAGGRSVSASEAGAQAPLSAPLLSAADRLSVEALQRLMTEGRVYREEGLTIVALAQRLGLPEHRLRRLINQGLGQRNFNQYLNGFRLADARAALADPARHAVPVLTIALDAGFQSLGPFNRAFKAATGQTPSDYRRQMLAAPPTQTTSSAPTPEARGAADYKPRSVEMAGAKK